MTSPLDVETRSVDDAGEAIAGIERRGDGARLDSGDSDAWWTVFRGLSEGESFQLHSDGESAGMIERGDQAGKHARPLSITPRRIGLYAPWSGSMDEGWMRFVLDTYDVPYVRVRNEMINAGDLGEMLDVLIIPSIRSSQLDRGRRPGSVFERFTGGLAPEGRGRDPRLRRGGWTTRRHRELLRLRDRPVRAPAGRRDARRRLQTAPAACSAPCRRMTACAPGSCRRCRSSSPAPRRSSTRRTDRPPCRILLRYAPTRLLLSGYVENPDVIEDHAAWVRAEIGDGEVHLFAFRPHYRSWSQAAFQLLFRAMVVDR